MADPLSLNGFDPSTILKMVGNAPAPDPMKEVLGRVQSQYPALAGQPWALVDSRGKTGQPGHLEFYPPDEAYNPRPGNATIELFDPALQGAALDQAVFGDMLHHMPKVDPYFQGQRETLRKTLTPEQVAMDRRAYEEARAEGEKRPFDEWMEQSRLDAYVRGRLSPDAADEWKDVYTPEQAKILDELKAYLMKPSKQTSGP